MIDTQKKRVSGHAVPLTLTRNELNIVLLLTQHMGETVPTRYLDARLRLRGTEGGVEGVIASVRQKISHHLSHADAARLLIQGNMRAGWRLMSPMQYDTAFEAYNSQSADFGWFTLNMRPDGTACSLRGDVRFDAMDVGILKYLHDHAAVHHYPADIARDLFKGAVSPIGLGRKLKALSAKIAKIKPAYEACLHFDTFNKMTRVMFVPHGMNLAEVKRQQLHDDIEIKNFGWFKLELSKRFNRKHTGVAARVAGTDLILDPRDTAALLYAHKTHGEWLNGVSIPQDALGPHVEAEHFFKHMTIVFDKLSARGLEPEKYILFRHKKYQKSFVRFLRYGVDYDMAAETPKQALGRARPAISPDTHELLNAGHWLTLDIRKDRRSIVRESNREFSKTATAIFKYSIQNPGAILMANMRERIFEKGVSVASFDRAVGELRDGLAKDGYGEAFYGARGKGVVFLTKTVFMSQQFNLQNYFNFLIRVQERQNAVHAEMDPHFIGPLQLRQPIAKPH